MIGRTIGRFRILTPLGEGGMGSVWLAEDTLLGRNVAIKLLSDHLVHSDAARARFVREARAASMLDHPGIATVFDAGEAGGMAYIAYRYVEGETLAQRCASSPLALAECLQLATGIAEALAHAHERGVIHRDITSANVMVSRDHSPVIIDFGLALPEDATHLTSAGTTLGTAPYLAPEVLRGEPASERSDLYGLGVILFRILTGRLPFEGPGVDTVLYQALNTDAPVPSTLRAAVPPRLDTIVLRLLEKDSRARYASGNQVAAELRGVMESLPSQALKGGIVREPVRELLVRRLAGWQVRWNRAARRLERARVQLSVLVAIAVVAVAGAVAWRQGWLPNVGTPIVTLAVLLPRESNPGTDDTSYLADAIGQETASRLAQVQGIRVLPWDTSRRFGDSTMALPTIARELNVDQLVVCDYHIDGDHVRANVALVDGKRGWQHWSGSFEEHTADLFALQRDIALAVALQLRRHLSTTERSALGAAPSRSPEAYEYYIRAAGYMRSEDPDLHPLIEPYFRKAIALDSTLAEAYVGLGAVYQDRFFRGELGGAANVGEAERYFRKALALDPRSLAARSGIMHVFYDREASEEVLKIASDVAVDSPDNVEGLVLRGSGYVLAGFPSSAVPPLRRALELDPANAGAAWFLVIALSWSDQHDDAVAAGKAYARKFGEDPEVYAWLAASSECVGAHREAQLYFDRAIQLFGDRSDLYVFEMQAYQYLDLGDRARVAEFCRNAVVPLEQRFEATPDNGRLRAVVIAFYGLLGRKDDVVRLAEPLFDPSSNGAQLSEAAQLDAIIALARVGRLDLARRACTLLPEKLDLGTVWIFESGCAGRAIAGPLPSALSDSPEFRELVRRVGVRRKELRDRYHL